MYNVHCIHNITTARVYDYELKSNNIVRKNRKLYFTMFKLNCFYEHAQRARTTAETSTVSLENP